MRLLYDGKTAFFAERGKTFSRPIVIRLPEGFDLLCNGAHFPAKRGTVTLPQDALHRGENRISLRGEKSVIPAESLFFDGATVFPVGFASDTMLVQEHLALSELTQTVLALNDRITRLEEAVAGRKLFT